MSLEKDLQALISDAVVPDSLAAFLLKQGVTSCALFYDCVKCIDDLEPMVFAKMDPPATSLQASATIRTVWRRCKLEAERKLSGESTLPEDWEVPLHTSTKNGLTSRCKAAYGFEFRAAKMPCDTLLGRVFREREKQALTVYPLARVRSLATQPQSRERRNLGSGFLVEQGVDNAADMSGSPYGFWLSLTILIHAYIIVGVDGWCPMQVALDYLNAVEERIWHAQTPGLKVIKAIELQHRTRWVELVRGEDALSLGDAIKRSIVELVGCWQFGTFSAGSGFNSSGSALDGQHKRQRTEGVQRASTPNASFIEKKGGEEICRKYNMGKCTSNACSYLHVCNYKKCGKNHPRCDNHQ